MIVGLLAVGGWLVYEVISNKGEEEAIEQIEEPIRKTISLYMKANNLKLSEGIHRFNRNDGTLEEYLEEEFRFETIK